MIITLFVFASWEWQGDYKKVSDKISILLEDEERLGIPKDCVSNSSIAQLTHDVCHMNHLPTAHDDSPQWPQNHTQPMQDPFVPFALEAHISHSYQQQMDIFYWILDITCAIFYLVLTYIQCLCMLRFGCLVECISFDLSANAIKMPGLRNNCCQILMTDMMSSIGGSATSWQLASEGCGSSLWVTGRKIQIKHTSKNSWSIKATVAAPLGSTWPTLPTARFPLSLLKM